MGTSRCVLHISRSYDDELSARADCCDGYWTESVHAGNRVEQRIQELRHSRDLHAIESPSRARSCSRSWSEVDCTGRSKIEGESRVEIESNGASVPCDHLERS